LRRDQRRLRELIRAGLRAQGLHLRARSVSLRSRSPTRPVLRVTDVLEPYELRSPDGTLVERRPGRGAVSWLVTLSREAGRWRIYDVVAS
jgi:hypothetical protein